MSFCTLCCLGDRPVQVPSQCAQGQPPFQRVAQSLASKGALFLHWCSVQLPYPPLSECSCNVIGCKCCNSPQREAVARITACACVTLQHMQLRRRQWQQCRLRKLAQQMADLRPGHCLRMATISSSSCSALHALVHGVHICSEWVPVTKILCTSCATFDRCYAGHACACRGIDVEPASAPLSLPSRSAPAAWLPAGRLTAGPGDVPAPARPPELL
jgi:hypothetical protein